ncbi:unnamed protein product [Medioppia subpectinata]|uniref:CRAL-TRIO domain-containing protein n=1 Tax=Medioppia subpectinata TaxID=1979941 RepID=A0A7R9PVV4_9ACAR|nr:unnamed protein product [Medioppia subpectinata]CAG2102205.1 unnamed protein product [Medioppia subpectinata]
MRQYYPESFRCVLVVNLPMLLEAFIPIIRLLLGSKYSPMLHTASAHCTQLFDYIDPDNVAQYLGGNNNTDFTEPPVECQYRTEKLAHKYGLDSHVVRKAVQKFEPHMMNAKRLFKQRG